MERLFYQRSAEEIANDLLGLVLVSRLERKKTAGLIVETEAYLADDDLACHGCRGRTRSNSAMFGPPGHAYVYPIHAGFCFNVVVGEPGEPTAVLIRAVQPVVGLGHMEKRRGTHHLKKLAAGPSRLCQSLGINRNVDHWDLTRRQRVWIQPPDSGSHPNAGTRPRILRTRRIGVTASEELLLRFVFENHPFASGPKHLRNSPQNTRN